MNNIILKIPNLPDTVLDKVKLTQSSANTLMTLLNDILDFSKIEAGQLKLEQRKIALHTVFKESTQIFKITALQHNVKFNLNGLSQLPIWVESDSVRLKQIINNLLTNAGKFTHEGEIQLNVAFEQKTLHFEVLDTGIGISEKQQKKLFTEFSQADSSTTRKYGGTGLGLTICHKLVALFGGTITLNSVINKGSNFKVSIPLKVLADTGSYQVSVIESLDLSSKTILLVEDNMINQIVAKTMLVSFGANIEIAEDGQAALDMLAVKSYSVVLMDCQMPIMDGLEATKIIRQSPNKYGVPCIIALTANAFDEDQQACLDIGMDDFISKPIAEDVLLAKLKKWCFR